MTFGDKQLASFRRLGRVRDFALSIATEGATLVLGLLVFKLAARYWGPTGFGEYVLARRGVSLAYLPVSCGMGLALTRYVAAAPHANRSQWDVLVAALRIAGLAAAVALVTLNVAPDVFGQLLLGERGHAELTRATSVGMLGMIVHGLVYSFFRGRLQLVRANVLQFFSLGLLPAAIFLIPGLGVSSTVLLIGTGWLVVACTALAVERGRSRAPVVQSNDSVAAITRELARYGLPRVPGELALAALFSLPTILAAHVSGVAEAGFVGFGTSLLSMVGAAFAPIGIIMLPAATIAVEAGTGERLWRDSLRITLLCVTGAAVLTLALELLAPWVVSRWLGPEFASAIPFVRVIALGGVPYVAYVVLRNVLDAAVIGPLNTRNLIVAVAVFGGVAAAADGIHAAPTGFALALTVLGALTVFDAWRVLRAPTISPA